ncbi:MAG: B12-binding domain-containing radical SAM protein, partial [Crenarchaeota archaeon]|nr:B12-binding domain-containing radical SAM protein [Thermoproteota archaeon]
DAINDLPLPGVVYGQIADEAEIPTIQGGTIDGIIEIARGCGRGCAFCVPTLQRFRSFSIEYILKEVDVNLKLKRRPLLHAEDVLRYKAKGFKVNEAAVKELFEKVYQRARVHYPKGIGSIAISHFALSSVASAPNLIADLSKIIEVEKGSEWMSGQCGVETGSPKLIETLMAGKAKPFLPEEWPKVVEDAFDILNKNNWVPLSTLILGLPNEDEEDVQLTIDLVERLQKYKSLLVPLFMVEEGGLKGKASSFTIDKITRKQSELFLKCWQHNLDWSEVLIKEYPITKGAKGYGVRHIFSYGINQGKKIIRQCKEEYDYDLPQLIKDAKNGKISITSMPIKLIYKIFKPKN